MRRLALALLLASCLHEPQVLHLRSDATPWPLQQPWEARLLPGRLVALRFDVGRETPALRFHCTAAKAVEMSVYGPRNDVRSRTDCRTVDLDGITEGAWFVVVRAVSEPTDVVLQAGD